MCLSNFPSKENNFDILGQLLIRPSLCAICAAEENPFKLSSEFVVERIFQQTRNLFNSIKCQQNIFVSNSNKQTIQINCRSGHSYLDVVLSHLKENASQELSPCLVSTIGPAPCSHMRLVSCLPNMMPHLARGLLNYPILIVRWPLGPLGGVKIGMKFRK